MTSAATTATREETLQALRIIADLHAAYGAGVYLDIDTGSPINGAIPTWVLLAVPTDARGGLTVSFWSDGDAMGRDDARGHVAVLDQVRAFLHEHGHGRR